MVPILPFDIIENIVGILIDDVKGLQYVKALSLTCPSFLPCCRKHIFSCIEIKIDSTRPSTQYPTAEAFERLLLDTPPIAKCVRHLTIHITQHRHSTHSFDQVGRQLTRLRSLTVSLWHHSRPSANNWNNIPSSMQSSLINLMHLPTLSNLYLESIRNFPIFNLITCASLKHLFVKDLDVSYEDEEGPFSLLHKPMQLQSLDIEISGWQTPGLIAARCADGRPVIDFTCLEKINIYFSFHSGWRDAALPTREIFSKAQRLTDISLKVNDIDFGAMKLAKMVTPSLQTLRRVELNVIIDSHSKDPLAVLCDELEHISGKNRLESIKIQIDLQIDIDCRSGTEWGRLEKVLLHSGWPMLKYISLVIVINSHYELRIDGPFGMALKNLPQTQFTGLMSSKNLDFRFSVQEIRI